MNASSVAVRAVVLAVAAELLPLLRPLKVLLLHHIRLLAGRLVRSSMCVCVCVCVCVRVRVCVSCLFSEYAAVCRSPENKPRKQTHTHTHIDRTAIFRPGHPRSTEVVSDAKLRPGHGDDFAANRNQSDHRRHNERYYTTSRLEPINLHTQ